MTRSSTVLADGFGLLEGPRWHDGRLYASDMFGGRVLAFALDGNHEVVTEVPAQPSGLGWDCQGRLLISSMNDQKLLRLENGELREFADLSGYVDGPANDMVVDTEGRAYVGNFGDLDAFGRTQLVRVDPDATVTRVGSELYFPNGACITPDGKTLLVAESFVARISAFDIAPDGSLNNRRDWATFGEPVDTTVPSDLANLYTLLPFMVDGMALDAEGCLWVADAMGNGALRVREGGEIVDRVSTEEQTAFAVALGGADGRTLFLCCATPNSPTVDHQAAPVSTLRTCQVDVAAAPAPAAQTV